GQDRPAMARLPEDRIAMPRRDQSAVSSDHPRSEPSAGRAKAQSRDDGLDNPDDVVRSNAAALMHDRAGRHASDDRANLATRLLEEVESQNGRMTAMDAWGLHSKGEAFLEKY